MDQLFFILSGVSLLIGVLAMLIGTFGLLKLPDVFSRIHAVGMLDTAGAGFIILGMLFYSGFTLISVKLAAIAIFLFFTGPIATHAVAQVAHRNGVSPLVADGGNGLVPASERPVAAKKTAKKAVAKKAVVKKAAKKAAAKTAAKKASKAGKAGAAK